MEPVVEDRHVRPDDEPGDVEWPFGGVVSADESRAADGSLLFVEVKGRTRDAETFAITRSEIGIGRNKPDQHILALAEVSATGFPDVRYIRRAFGDISDLPFDAVSVDLHWRSYFDRGEVPA